jgi:hypothetical protein
MVVPLVKPRISAQKLLDSERSEFPTDARVLETAERLLLIVKHAIDCYATGQELRCHAARSLNVGPAHKGMEAEPHVVDNSEGIFFGFVDDVSTVACIFRLAPGARCAQS